MKKQSYKDFDNGKNIFNEFGTKKYITSFLFKLKANQPISVISGLLLMEEPNKLQSQPEKKFFEPFFFFGFGWSYRG